MSLFQVPPITTDFIYPPIPIRSNDWVAYFEGEEEAGAYGYGETEADAIEDFLVNWATHHLERMGRMPEVKK